MLVLSYFSYKGGSGRSSLAYNTIPFLVENLQASKEHPIIVVDLDVDSAGLSYLLTEQKIERGKDVDFLTTDKLLDSKLNLFGKYAISRDTSPKNFDEFELYKLFLPVGTEFGLNHIIHSKSVLFVPVKPDKTVSKFDGPTSTNISDFIKTCENYGASAVIFDMPAGGQVVGKSAFEISDKIILCMRITKQHRAGTLDFLEGALGGVATQFIPVLNVVPQEKVIINGLEYNIEAIRNNLKKQLEELNLKIASDCDFDFEMLDYEYFGIPEVKRFKFFEGILYSIKNKGVSLTADEELAYEAYKHLADIIAKDNI